MAGSSGPCVQYCTTSKIRAVCCAKETWSMKKNRLRTTGLLIMLACSSFAAPTMAASLDEAVTIDLRAQPLGDALRELAKQSGLQLLFDPALVEGKQASAITGKIALSTALHQLLRGTNLEAHEQSPGVLTIRQQPSGGANAPANTNEGAASGRKSGLTVASAVSSREQPPIGGIEEVIVTAERRESSLQHTPIAISAMTSDALLDQGITNLEGVINASPSVTFSPYSATSNTLAIYMRGTGIVDAGQITIDTAVGLYQDGFYISRGQMVTFDLADVERVEVLRGPQGALYGRNTTGGAINLISKRPTGEFGFKQELGVGNNGRFRSLSAVNLPQWNGLSAKFSVLRRKQDGFVKNLGPGHDFGVDEQGAERVALRWDAQGAYTADYFYERGEMDSTPYYYTNTALVGLLPGYSDRGRPEHHSYRAISLPKSPGSFKSQGLTLSWSPSDSLVLRSLTGYREISVAYNQNYADTFFVGFQSLDDIRTHQFSQEFQLVGNTADDRIDYVAGLYWFKESGNHLQNTVITNVLPGSDSLRLEKHRFVKMESKSKALYAQLTWRPPVLDDRLDFTFGGRYTKDTRSAERRLLTTYFGFPIAEEPVPGLRSSNDLRSSRFNSSFTAQYAVADEINAYFRVATGYKAGGSSESVAPGQFGITFAPEDVVVYELGLKSYLFDRHVRLNVAAFESKYKDMQLFFNTDPSDLSVILGVNAGKATIRGVELELLWQPADALSFTVDYTWLEPKYKEALAPAGTLFDPAVNSASPHHVGDDVKQLFSFVQTPKNTVNIGATWRFLSLESGDFTAVLNYRWQDRFFNGAGSGSGVPNYKLTLRPPVGLFDGRISWKTEVENKKSSIRLDLWGRNLADKKHPLFVMGAGSPVPVYDTATGTLTPAGYAEAVPTAWAERRSYGIDLIYEF